MRKKFLSLLLVLCMVISLFFALSLPVSAVGSGFTTPGFNPAAGAVTFPSDITINGYGADHVYYTTDGTTPATSVTGTTLEYTGPITISSNVTIKARSTKSGCDPSSVATASYLQAASALTGLVLSGTPTGFTFAPDTLTYNGVQVASGVTSITVTPTGAGTITVNGTEVISGTASGAIPLAMGVEESISIVVAQTGKSSTTYTINVTRRSDIWDGVTTTSFTGGGNSAADPYIIDTAEKLAYLAAQVNSGQPYIGKYFELTADIALNDTSNWQTWDENTSGLHEWIPIGDDAGASNYFRGVFDGGGYTIRGVYISDDESQNQGLFGFVYGDGIVRNLGVTQSFISGGEVVGGVAGRFSDGTVEYCWFSGTVRGVQCVGGVVGSLDGSAQYCYNTGSVSGMQEVGGVFGIIGESTISNCYNAGAVSGGYRIGGITGICMENVTDCYNSGVVTGLSIPALDTLLAIDPELPPGTYSPLYVGAIIGETNYPGQITGCCYDKQMSREAGVGGSTESADTAETVGKLTTGMCNGNPGFISPGDWVFENGLYPRLTGMDTTDGALVSATPVRLPSTSPTEFEKSEAVKSDFIVGTPSGVGWTSSNTGVIAINDGIAGLTRQSSDTTLILTATKNGVSKQVPLNVLAAPAAITPTSGNYDLNAPANVTTTITWNGASSVTGIAYGATALAAPADYSVSGNTLTVDNDFFAGLSPALNDVINLVITFNTQDTATLTVNVVDGFVAVSGISGVPTTATAGTPRTLTGTVAPANATNQTIVWSVADAGTTGATISGNTLTTSGAGTLVVRATITNGLTASSDYTQNFNITVNSAGGGSDDSTPPSPQRTITVTETSSRVFIDTDGRIRAEANMDSAFANSVEVKVTDTAEDVASFNLSAGDEVYPFDISLYIKGTNEKTEPADGYAVTISLPIPENLLHKKELLSVVHKSDSGFVTMLASHLEQKDGVWYLVFEATEFSPYALVVRNSASYDESAGVPFYLDTGGNKVFIGFAANSKYIAPEGVTVSVMQNDKSFTDVSGHWAASNIGFTTERELFVGTGSNIFSPDMGMTRAMFATVTGRLYERSYGEIMASETQAFIDCDYAAYYGKYIVWAAENGIIGGSGKGRFGPDDQITREQMAAILYRFADFLGVLPSGMDTALEYPDAASISSYAKDAALYCQTTGVIGGRSGGVFAPQETATRAEVAAIIQRFIETVMK